MFMTTLFTVDLTHEHWTEGKGYAVHSIYIACCFTTAVLVVLLLLCLRKSIKIMRQKTKGLEEDLRIFTKVYKISSYSNLLMQPEKLLLWRRKSNTPVSWGNAPPPRDRSGL